jgi:hypothetical protein
VLQDQDALTPLAAALRGSQNPGAQAQAQEVLMHTQQAYSIAA